MSELKRCPFCGGIAYMIDLTDFRQYYVRCNKCKVEQGHLYNSKNAAIKAWNRRKS